MRKRVMSGPFLKHRKRQNEKKQDRKDPILIKVFREIRTSRWGPPSETLNTGETPRKDGRQLHSSRLKRQEVFRRREEEKD